MAEVFANHMFHRFLMAAMQYEQPWRQSNQRNFSYYDGDQWTEDEKREFFIRGQQPTVINTIKPTVNMVSSVEKNRRVDIQVCGREEGDDKKAVLLTALLKHVFSTCNFDYFHGIGFKEAYIGGRSWFECMKYSDELGKDLIKVEKLPWEDVYCDPFSRKPDASDARYIIKVKWLDRDVVKKLFPDAEPLIDNVFNSYYQQDFHGQEQEAQLTASDRGQGFYYNNKTQRVRVCECYYTMPEKKTVKKLNEETGKKEDREIFVNAVHYVIFSDDIILQGSATNHAANKNPLGIDYYPIIPLYCMRDRDGRPRGGVQDLIDIQDQVNKLNSKFLWTLASNRLLAEEGALKDLDEAKEQFMRPDGLVVLNEGGIGKVKIDEKFRDLSFMSNHINFLMATEQRLSGVNDSMLGVGGTNERSGVMQSTRISQGAAMHSDILENMFYSKQRIALVLLRMIGKFYTDYRVVRIVGANGLTETYEFNKRVPVQEMVMQGQQIQDNASPEQIDMHTVDMQIPQKQEQMPEYSEQKESWENRKGYQILNQIDDTLYYDVFLKEVPPFDSMRDRMLTIFSEVLKTNVIPAPVAAKILLSLADVPNKQDLILELENFYKEQQAAAQASAAEAAQAIEQQQGAM